ncbi:ABC transporter permease [Variovorax sp. SCN 67-20]|uniref:ABC transporter permease n=1 Tax=Variovorax sp. SCN 67-20 TaxID=1660153 RepID=UPI0025F930A9|nr:ABC transporter permease [Variovorax sp. SCN 67-20]
MAEGAVLGVGDQGRRGLAQHVDQRVSPRSEKRGSRGAAVSLAAIGWALLVATLTRTPQQATVVGGVGNILMGAIGGVMVPKFMMPAAMQQLAALSPMAWGLDGLHTVALRHGGLAEIAGQLGLLFAFAGGTLLLAVLVSRKSA